MLDNIQRASLTAIYITMLFLLSSCNKVKDKQEDSPFDRFENEQSLDEKAGKAFDKRPRAGIEEVTSPTSQIVVENFRLCGAKRVTCVVDGDTIWLHGTKIRIADIDTPEVSEPKCAAEKALGDRATLRLLELLNTGPFQLQVLGSRDSDRYGRKLRVIERNGASIADQLVEEGLARAWTGRRQPWC